MREINLADLSFAKFISSLVVLKRGETVEVKEPMAVINGTALERTDDMVISLLRPSDICHVGPNERLLVSAVEDCIAARLGDDYNLYLTKQPDRRLSFVQQCLKFKNTKLTSEKKEIIERLFSDGNIPQTMIAEILGVSTGQISALKST